MEFGLLQFFSWPRRNVPLETVYERALERIEIMDKTGYEAIWLAEHHFTGYSVCPSVHMMGMHVAHRTENIRIGTAVSLASFYHPLRLAEEVAMLDVLSGGRVNWGAGRGFDPTEFATFGVPLQESKERFHEAVEIVLAAWHNEKLTWKSKNWEFNDVEVLPKPAQQPHPPVWMAAGSDDSVKWAAEEGHTVMLGPHNSFREIANRRDLYCETLEANGHEMGDRVIPMTRFIAVAGSDDEAAEIARRGAAWLVATYKNESKGVPNPTETITRDGTVVQSDDPIQRYLDNVAIWGTPEKVYDMVQELEEEMHLQHLMLAPLSHSSFMEFTDKVLPKLL